MTRGIILCTAAVSRRVEDRKIRGYKRSVARYDIVHAFPPPELRSGKPGWCQIPMPIRLLRLRLPLLDYSFPAPIRYIFTDHCIGCLDACAETPYKINDMMHNWFTPSHLQILSLIFLNSWAYSSSVTPDA